MIDHMIKNIAENGTDENIGKAPFTTGCGIDRVASTRKPSSVIRSNPMHAAGTADS